MKKTLVVFYSRSGQTRQVAQRLARALDADIEQISESRSRAGVLGYLRSAVEALLCRGAPIAASPTDPRRYEQVIIGTPVWAGHMSSPVRSYLTRHASALNRVGFFCTYGGSGADTVLSEMADLAGRTPIATLAITDREIAQANDKPIRFAAALRIQPA